MKVSGESADDEAIKAACSGVLMGYLWSSIMQSVIKVVLVFLVCVSSFSAAVRAARCEQAFVIYLAANGGECR
jgi:hypothetical protein